MAARERGGRFASLLRRGRGRKQSTAEPLGFELVVVEGIDAGTRFVLNAPEVQVGRGNPDVRRRDQILLSDRSVSSKHAIISSGDGRVTVQHLKSATNPTLVNGRPIKTKRLKPGDQIALGLVVLQLYAIEPEPEPTASVGDEDSPAADATVFVPTAEADTVPKGLDRPGDAIPAAELVLLAGVREWEGRRFEIARGGVTVGRAETCDIALPVRAVSRRHVSLEWQGSQLVLVHESEVNPTQVNGAPVPGRQVLSDGDEVCLAETVTFGVLLEEPARGAADDTILDDSSGAVTPVAGRAGIAASTAVASADAETQVMTPPPQSEAQSEPPAGSRSEAEPTRVFTPADELQSESPAGSRSEAEPTRVFAPADELQSEPPASSPGEAEATRVLAPEDAPAEADGADVTATIAFQAPDVDAVQETVSGASLAEQTAVLEEPLDGASREPDATTVRSVPIARDGPNERHGRLVLNSGVDGWEGRRFELDRRRTGIGRNEDCEISLPVTDVSRRHAAILWEADELVLIHESDVNSTRVNGEPVASRRILAHGDEIKLSDRVSFYVILDLPVGANETAPELSAPADPAEDPGSPADDADPGRTRIYVPPPEDEARRNASQQGTVARPAPKIPKK